MTGFAGTPPDTSPGTPPADRTEAPAARMLAMVIAGVVGFCQIVVIWQETFAMIELHWGGRSWAHPALVLLALAATTGAILLAAGRPQPARVLLGAAVPQAILGVFGILPELSYAVFGPLVLATCTSALLAGLLAVAVWLPPIAKALPAATPPPTGYGWPAPGMPPGYPAPVPPGGYPGQPVPGFPGAGYPGQPGMPVAAGYPSQPGMPGSTGYTAQPAMPASAGNPLPQGSYPGSGAQVPPGYPPGQPGPQGGFPPAQ